MNKYTKTIATVRERESYTLEKGMDGRLCLFKTK